MAREHDSQTNVTLTPSERDALERFARKRSAADREKLRARIILACADGLNDVEVGNQLGVHNQTVANQRLRYLVDGVAGLRDRPRPGRATSVTSDAVEQLLVATISRVPEGGGPWSPELMQNLGWSPRMVRQVWREHGVNGADIQCLDVKDGLLVGEDWYVTGFYQGDLGRAVVLGLRSADAPGIEPLVFTGAKQSDNPDAARLRTVGSSRTGDLGRLVQFLNAVKVSTRDRYGLQFITDSLPLHFGALLWNGSSDGLKLQAFHARDIAAWDDLVDKLIGLMEERWWTCGAHDRGTRLAEAAYGGSPVICVWQPVQGASQNGVECSCREHRSRLMMPRYMSEWAKDAYDNGRWRSCRCKDLRYCLHCCYRRFRSIVRKVSRRWIAAFGKGPAVHSTLTYWPSLELRTGHWLERARRDFDRLRREWKRDWGDMPPHLMSLEWTRQGLPHFHLLIPWEGEHHFRTLSDWLWRTWTRLIGGRVDRRTRFIHTVSTAQAASAERAIKYILKTLKWPLWQVMPPGTPRFHRWYASYRHKDWESAPRPGRLI